MRDFIQKVLNYANTLPFWLICGLVLIISRMATWLFPFNSDHWIFYYVGRRWAEGGTLYVDMWDHKSPLIFGFNAILYKLFGDNLALHRVVFTIIALLTIWVFYKTIRLLLTQIGSKNISNYTKISTLLYIFFANISQFTNSANNNENIAMLPLLGSVYFYLKYRQKESYKWYWLLLSGLLAGIVFTMKANFAILLLPIFIDIVYLHRRNIFKILYSLAIFGLATVAQLGMWIVYFKHIGTFREFWIATFEFNSKYIRALGWDLNAPKVALLLLIVALPLIFFAPFLFASISRFRKFLRSKDYNPELIVTIMSVSVLLFVAMAGTFYSHYFLIIIPYLCLISGATMQYIVGIKYPKTLLLAASFIIVFSLMISYKQLYNTFTGPVAAEIADQRLAAEYIKAHTNSNDTIFSNTYGSIFYRLTERDSGTRFLSASHLLIDYKHHFGYDFNGLAIKDMDKSKPKYVIISADPDDLYLKQNPVMTKYINDNYTFEATVAGYQILVRK